jgi:hypothetical protein
MSVIGLSFKYSVIGGGLGFAWGKGQDLFGAEGKQRLDIKASDFIFGVLGAIPKIVEETKEFFGKDKGPENEPFGGFVFTPKFDLKNVEDVGKSIQKGLLADAGKSPEVKAIETLDARLRGILSLTEEQVKTLRQIVEEGTDFAVLR